MSTIEGERHDKYHILDYLLLQREGKHGRTDAEADRG